MALEYQIPLGRTRGVHEVEEWIQDIYAAEGPVIRLTNGVRHVRLPGVTVSFREIIGTPWAECITETFRIEAIVGLTYRFINQEHEAAYVSLFRSVEYFLARECELVLLANGESPLLLKRHQSELLVNNDWKAWLASHFDWTAQEHKVVSLSKL